jgi:hypothetical protein
MRRGFGNPRIKITDNCAIQVIDDKVTIVGSGEWHRFNAGR